MKEAMRSTYFLAVCWAMGLCCLALPARGQNAYLAFKNLEGVPAAGLMLELEPTRCRVSVGQGGPFAAWAGGEGSLRLYNGQVAPQQAVRLVLNHNCGVAVKVTDWWWTDDNADRIGRRKSGLDPERTVSSNLQEYPGYQTLTFTTVEGELALYLPIDMSPGETFSASLQLLPAGDSERERQRNLEQLRTYGVSIADIDVQRGRWIGRLPEQAQYEVPVDLWDADGAQVHFNVAAVTEPPPPSEAVRVPTVCQADEVFLIEGNFDGDTSNTTVTLGTARADLLAESTRHLLVVSPRAPIGVQTIEIHDTNQAAAGQVRNVVVSFDLQDVEIRTGETLNLPLSIRGLDNLEVPLQLEITNRSIVAADLLPSRQGRQTITIEPQQVRAGAFNSTIQIQGTVGGRLDIRAQLVGLTSLGR